MNDERRKHSPEQDSSSDSRSEGTSRPASENRVDGAVRASGTGSLVRDVALYSLARLGLVAVLALVILYVPRAFGVEIPLLVAVLFAVLIALPLSLVLFKSLRRRVNEGIAAVDERRRTDREDLENRLRGEGRR
ncbi:DUF4229 domain-containing protein [Rhodococcus coprophilus]|uniref:Hypothetical membrane protein n=1 Tax=Rhodococcus coprophilus TaxID=38310 RepID=A0A2X4XC09_9NOCA|nr:hypothetical protein [Rhodococcus coprophilus]SQI37325.1 hypothetical membrane protein [Rhodococcus coprophilus]